MNDFVYNKLNPQKSSNNPTEILEEWLSVILSEEYEVKTKIAENILKLPNETHIEVFIHNYQRRLINLADHLYSYQNFNEVTFDFPNDNTISLLKLQKVAYQTFEDLINYLKTHYEKYFIFDEKPSRRSVLIAVIQFTHCITDIQGLTNEPNICIDAVASALAEFIHNPEKITFRKIDYLQKLVQELLDFNHQTIEKNLHVYLKYKLFYMNFNSVSFAIQLIAEYEAEIAELNTTNEKIEKLAWYLKRITQIPVQNAFTYDSRHKSLKDHVSHWLIEEMYFLEKRNLLAILPNQDMDGNTSVFKIPTEMSVPQLAYFLKVLVGVEIIRDIKNKELLRYFAKHTKTKGAESISPESLRIRFYDIDEGTKDEVKSIIIKMLNFIQNHKNYIIFLINASMLQMDGLISNMLDVISY